MQYAYRVVMFFLLMIGRHPRRTLFPYTTLFRSRKQWPVPDAQCADAIRPRISREPILALFTRQRARDFSAQRDRKSTRLNSSHGYISYAVFCLKKKNTRSTSTTSV